MPHPTSINSPYHWFGRLEELERGLSKEPIIGSGSVYMRVVAFKRRGGDKWFSGVNGLSSVVVCHGIRIQIPAESFKVYRRSNPISLSLVDVTCHNGRVAKYGRRRTAYVPFRG